MNWYNQQNQQQGPKYTQFIEKQNDKVFESIYDDPINDNYDFWMPLIEDVEQDYLLQINNQQMILQGMLQQKQTKPRKWEPQHLELFQDKLVRVQLNSENQPMQEYCSLNKCFLKKIQFSESSFQSYKFGFRLQMGKKKAEFFTESNEIFVKWHNHLKRYTLLSKFSKKYKLVQKLNIPEQSKAYSTYQAIKLQDNFHYQVRVIDKNLLQDQQRIQLLKEIGILRRLDHQYLSKLLEVYEDVNFLYIVFECYAGREIKYGLQDIVSAPEKVVAELMYKLLLALSHCHSKNVFHRDLKFETIFHKQPESLTEICITNFYTAEIYEENQIAQFKRIGTPGFLAPEVFESKFYDSRVDIFSLGVLFYFFVFARMPFGNEYSEILYNNERGDIDLNLRTRYSTSAIDLMCQLVKKDPNKRPSAFQALNHHWFINMKIKEQVNRNLLAQHWQLPSLQNLSTIFEKSDYNLDSSINYQMVQSKRRTKPQTRSKSSTELTGLDDEFDEISLQDKLKGLQTLCPPKIPSKSRHLFCDNSSSPDKMKQISNNQNNGSQCTNLNEGNI